MSGSYINELSPLQSTDKFLSIRAHKQQEKMKHSSTIFPPPSFLSRFLLECFCKDLCRAHLTQHAGTMYKCTVLFLFHCSWVMLHASRLICKEAKLHLSFTLFAHLSSLIKNHWLNKLTIFGCLLCSAPFKSSLNSLELSAQCGGLSKLKGASIRRFPSADF